VGVAERFGRFLSNIALTNDQKVKGAERRAAVVRVLNRHYWNVANDTTNSTYVGSWGKLTRIRPPRDVDVIFNLPQSVYDRFQLRSGNRQSQLLQEVKGVLAKSFTTTSIRGDGPVVLVPFSAYDVELVPAFPIVGGGHWISMTDAGGRYKKADYVAEANAISASNQESKGNTRDLVRMMKRWQGHCSVPIKSFHIELLATDFIKTWTYRGNSMTWYDFMVRDFLAYMVDKSGTYLFAPGTWELMNAGSAWKSRAETALARAKLACSYEAKYPGLAGDEWQKIFGPDIPRTT
jgi:hypothetical protein